MDFAGHVVELLVEKVVLLAEMDMYFVEQVMLLV
jgi:hypothetical protein